MKKIIITILMLMVLIGIVSAATVVTLDTGAILTNNSFTSSTSVTPNMNVTGNQSTYTCVLYANTGGTYVAKETDSNVANDTNINFTAINALSDGTYLWDVFCNGTTDTVGARGATGNYTFTIDATDPVINVSTEALSPTSGEWQTTAAVIIGATVTDNNADSCIVYTTMNATANATQTYGAYDTGSESYTNATALNFTGFDTGNTNMADNNTGAYIYSMTCNDSAGNTASTSNVTFYIDTTAPSAFSFQSFKTNNRALWNATRATDYTPEVTWNITTELNFSRYELTFYYNASVSSATNITNISTLSANISTLVGDLNPYTIRIIAYDEAGNSRNMTEQDQYYYGTDSTNRVLKAGWNIIGNVGNAFNLSNLLSWAGATTVSLWNSTHEFVSHVSGGSNGNENVTAGNPVLLYVATNTNFEDMIWNTTATDAAGPTITLLNSSSSGSNSAYNLIMRRNSTGTNTFGAIDAYINCNAIGGGCAQEANNASNVDYMSWYNNSATSNRYVSFVANWSISNTTALGFGDSVWMNVLINQTFNWSAI